MKNNGIFISFEGIDGAGKSTHIETLAQCFQKQGIAVTLTREPGGTPLAEKLRSIVLNDAMDPMTEALLVFAARRDHLKHVIEPALARGDVVICDRFTDSTFAYQGGGHGFDLQVLSVLEQWVQSGIGKTANNILQPELTLWFDLPPLMAAQRLSAARTPDKFEAQSVAFFERVSSGYKQRAEQFPARFARINAAHERDTVWQSVLAAVQAKGWLA